MQKRASFIQIGDRYYATIKTASSENVLKENGKNKPFDSATRAMDAALKAIEATEKIEIDKPEPEKDIRPGIVKAWNEDRLRRRQADREMATLMGVQVVTLKRKVVRR